MSASYRPRRPTAPTLLALVALAVGLPVWGGAADLGPGMARLERGEWRMAGDQFRKVLADDPTNAAALAGLGRALVGQGRCPEALPLLRSARGGPAWDARVALGESDCLARLGRAAEAEAAALEAVLLGPELARAWYELAMLRFEAGDLLGAEDAIAELDRNRRGAAMALVARAWIAYETGDSAFPAALDDLRGHVEAEPTLSAVSQADLLDGLAWLDAGDPVLAAAVLQEASARSLHHLRLAAWLAEALRRQGLAADALNVLARPVVARASSPLADAFEARALADQGDLDVARALVARLPDPDEPEALATRWYLAHRAGDPAADELAALWRARVRVSGRALEQLIPLSEVR